MLTSVKITRDEHGKREVIVNGQQGIKVTQGNSPTGGHAGISKTVFFVDDYVVKFGSGYEAEMWIDEKDRKNFAMVVYADINRKWYIQERVNCEPNARVSPEHVKKVKLLSRKYGFGDIGSIDGYHYGAPDITIGHNFTLDLNGTPIIYDYEG